MAPATRSQTQRQSSSLLSLSSERCVSMSSALMRSTTTPVTPISSSTSMRIVTSSSSSKLSFHSRQENDDIDHDDDVVTDGSVIHRFKDLSAAAVAAGVAVSRVTPVSSPTENEVEKENETVQEQEYNDDDDDDDQQMKSPVVSRKRKSKSQTRTAARSAQNRPTSDHKNVVTSAASPPPPPSTPPPPSPPTTKRTTTKRPARDSVVAPPPDWQQVYRLVEELRHDRTAPCDWAGCEALPIRDPSSPATFRFQVLICLMLSSQTKDAVVADAIRAMQRDGVLTIPAIAAMPPAQLDRYIGKVGFHNNKTKYIKQVVEILQQDPYHGDIPKTAAEMMDRLPGVGPKMAYLCENVAWQTYSGIGVDTHMHRLFNRLGWVYPPTKTPEDTRKQLQAWLPQDRWPTVNLLWVGFGQEIQQYKEKILRKALACSQPKQALQLLQRCGLDIHKESQLFGLQDEIRVHLE